MHINIPLSGIEENVKNMREEHDENKEKRKKLTFSSINAKKCLDECTPNKDGNFDCMVDSYWKTREQCQRYEDKDLVKLENLKIEKLEHKFKSMKDNIAIRNQDAEKKKKIKKVCLSSHVYSSGVWTHWLGHWNECHEN